MTAPAVARRGELLPGFMLPTIDGSSVSMESYRGRTNLVVVFAGDMIDESPVAVLLEELVRRREQLTVEGAQVLVVVTAQPAVPRRGRWAFPVLVDNGAHMHRSLGATDAVGRPAPAVFVTDRFREIYAAYLPGQGSALPGAQEISDWLVFINIQCPECGVPEWPR
ncbi:MAG TPA: redoxin domain-containing protein [Gemmatimonadales bacterium]|jgi:peroxiredoxin